MSNKELCDLNTLVLGEVRDVQRLELEASDLKRDIEIQEQKFEENVSSRLFFVLPMRIV